MPATLGWFNPFQRTAKSQHYSPLPRQNRDKPDVEKRGNSDRVSSGEYDYSCPSSPGTSSNRSSFDSHPSSRPIMRRKPPVVSYRYEYYRMPRKVVNHLCLLLIISLMIFVAALVR